MPRTAYEQEEQSGRTSGPTGGEGAPVSLLARAVVWYLLRFRRPEPVSYSEAISRIRRILVMPGVGVTGILFAMPTVRALRWGLPDSKIAVLVREEDKDLLDGARKLDRVIGYSLEKGVRYLSSFIAQARRLRSYRFDLAVNLDSSFSLERALLCYLTGASIRAGLESDESHPFFNLEVSRRVRGRASAQPGLEIARVMGIDVSGFTLHWEVPERERRLAEQLIHFRKPRDEELLIGFDPGPGRSGTSVSLPQQAKLLDRLCADYQAKAILLTAPEQNELARRLESLLSREPIVVHQRRMRDVVSLLSQCDLFVGGNTDLLYFSVALGIPTVCLVTPEERGLLGLPKADRLEVVELTPGAKFPIRQFAERTQAVLLAASD